MIQVSLDPGGFHRAAQQLADRIDDGLRMGMEATMESIAARAKQTTTFTDRTGALRNSIQSDGVTGGGGAPFVGVVSFAAVSTPSARTRSGRKRRAGAVGAQYGIFLEMGTVHIRERRFIRDAIDEEDGDLIEGALSAVFVGTGFEVVR